MKKIVPLIGGEEVCNLSSEINKIASKNIKQDDVLICSYPRSGNTWVRLLLTSYLLYDQGYEFKGANPIHPDRIIPDLHLHSWSDVDDGIRIPAKIAKTHSVLASLFTRRIIYIARQPVDSLVSYYHFHRRYAERYQKVKYFNVDEFSIVMWRGWAQHVLSFLNHSRSNDDFFITYELLHRENDLTLRSMLSFLNIDINDEAVKKAVENNKFSMLKKIENDNSKTGRFINGEKFFRKGRIGGGREELSQETLDQIDAWSEEIYLEILARQKESLLRVH